MKRRIWRNRRDNNARGDYSKVFLVHILQHGRR